jgi:hypothetical protein
LIYSNFFKSIKKSSEDNVINSNLELIYSIFKTENELSNAISNYEYAEDDLIDYYSYHIKATKSKLNFLMKKAKNRGIILERSKQIELKTYDEKQAM